MKKLLSMMFIGLIVFSTLALAVDVDTSETQMKENCWYLPSLTPQKCVDEYGPNYVPHENDEVQLDIVFVVDSTGSMHDELRTIKEELINIMDKINSGQPRPDVRVGVVTYRDFPENRNEYLTKSHELTYDLEEIEDFIGKIEARAGGDYEEAVEMGLHKAIHDMKWRTSSHKAILLIGDAPARDHHYQDQPNYGNYPEVEAHVATTRFAPEDWNQLNYVSYNWKDAIEDAQDRNIRIYTASGSGMNQEGINQWKTIAGKTGGSYIQLIYERRNIIEYYEERSIPVEYIPEAIEDPDYEESTNSIMTNNFGLFASKSMMGMAEDAGVDYSGSLDDITGEIVKEQTNTQTKNFLEKIISKLLFWE